MEMGGLMGGFYRISEWIMRFSVTNLLWILFNVPVLFFALNILFAEDLSQLIAILIPIAILAPFVTFPATAAMFSVVRKWIMGDADVPLLKTFWKGYKSNYKQSMFGGLVIVPLWAIYIFDFFFYAMEINSVLRYLFIVLGVLLLAFSCHFFSMTVHFHMKFWSIMKNAALIAIGRPLISVGIILINGLILYISFYQLTWLLPFFTASGMAYFSFMGFYHIYNKAQQAREKQEEQAKQDGEAEQDERGDGETEQDELAARDRLDGPETGQALADPQASQAGEYDSSAGQKE